MKKSIQIIFILIGLVSCKKQDINGVWMSYDDRIINLDKGWSGGMSGFVIDFDNHKWNHMLSDSNKTIDFNFQKKQIRLNPDTTKIDFKIYGKDSIEIELFQNIISVFHPLCLDYKINKTKKQIFDYLTKNKFKNIKDSTNIIFSETIYRFATTKELRVLKGKAYESSLNGYWHLGEIQNNYFLFFAISEVDEPNIYQITTIEKNKIGLKKIQETDLIFGLTELIPVYNNTYQK